MHNSSSLMQDSSCVNAKLISFNAKFTTRCRHNHGVFGRSGRAGPDLPLRIATKVSFSIGIHSFQGRFLHYFCIFQEEKIAGSCISICLLVGSSRPSAEPDINCASKIDQTQRKPSQSNSHESTRKSHRHHPADKHAQVDRPPSNSSFFNTKSVIFNTSSIIFN